MIDRKRFRPRLLSALLLLLGFLAYRGAAGYAEGKIAARLERAATTAGVRVRYDRLRVGLFPPVRLTGVAIEKPGRITVFVDSISVTPRLHGPRGFGLLGRVRVGAVRLPAQICQKLREASRDCPAASPSDISRSRFAEAESANLTTLRTD